MDKYKITFETWNKIADLYQEKFMNLDIYNESYDFFCEQLKANNAAVLEIGCGPGNITKYLLTKNPKLQIHAIDIALNMIQLAQKNNPSANFQVLDARAIHQINQKFDAIICGFCLPYLSKEDVIKLIKDSAHLLNKKGLFYFSFIEGEYQKSGFEQGSTGDKAYVYYHQNEFLIKQLKEHEFELLKTINIEYPQKNNTIQSHIILIASKK